MSTDLLGNPLTEPETAILAVYEQLKTLVVDEDLPPLAAAGLRDALARVGVVVTDLALEFEHLVDIGV